MANREQPAFALDHHIARPGRRGGHQSNSFASRRYLRPDPLSPATRLPRAPAGEIKPDTPIAVGGELLLPGAIWPIVKQLNALFFR
jgi:hypothetical protein